tara:strand:- start:3151 stop:4896 length:1746 start_codon:yes stop_codon:yes gene_type:complete
MQIVLFGLGRAGCIHYKNVLNHPHFKISYIVDLIEISHKLEDDIKIIDINNIEKIKEVLSNPDIKAVIIASPTKTHYNLTMMALSYNKHVFIEKPLCEKLNDIKDCFNLAKKNNCILFVGYNRRYDPCIKNIKSKIDSNEIGNVKYAFTVSRDYPYPEEKFLKICSGIFHDCATHDIDYLNWILKDKPVSVNVCVNSNIQVNDFNYDYVLINFTYSLGTIVCLNLSRISSSYDQRCEFYGDKGEIINNNYDATLKNSFPERYEQAFKNELDEFYKCIKNNTLPIVTCEDCISNFIIAQACEESINKNKTISIKYSNEFRNYDISSKSVYQNYLNARTNQTVSFVSSMINKFSKLDDKMYIWSILEELNSLTDVSDPDLSHPNLYHAIQTAEMMKKDNLPDWMQLVGLIHDIGKIMYKKGCDSEGTGISEQWAMVGDTFIVGCKLPDKLIYPEFNQYNPDMSNPRYNTILGMYQKGCGLDNLTCSWGHDEYLYRILSSPKNPNIFPPEALYIIRWHSLYPYHDKGEYYHFKSDKDIKFFPLLKLFNKYDLYSKSDDIYDIEKLKPYYINLITKYFTNPFLYI